MAVWWFLAGVVVGILGTVLWAMLLVAGERRGQWPR